MNNKPPQFPDDIITQHICGSLCSFYSVGHLISFKNKEYLRTDFIRLFVNNVFDKRIFNNFQTNIAKPEDSKAYSSTVLSQFEIANTKKVEDYIKGKLKMLNYCPACQEKTVF